MASAYNNRYLLEIGRVRQRVAVVPVRRIARPVAAGRDHLDAGLRLPAGMARTSISTRWPGRSASGGSTTTRPRMTGEMSGELSLLATAAKTATIPKWAARFRCSRGKSGKLAGTAGAGSASDSNPRKTIADRWTLSLQSPPRADADRPQLGSYSDIVGRIHLRIQVSACQ